MISILKMLALAFPAVLAASPGAAMTSEQVEFDSGAQKLSAALFRPEGGAPVPVVVAMHGCGGLRDANGRIQPHFLDWGEILTRRGFAVLFPDSFGSRGLGSQCRVRPRSVKASDERVADARAARAWLQAQDWVQADRVSLLGWSNGGSTVLWAVRPHAAPKDSHPDFRTAIALYPGCRGHLETAWSTRIPTLILAGAADDWTPARDCEQMIAGARGRSAQAAIVIYPGAYHDFDHANMPVRLRKGLAFSGDGSGRAHAGGDPQARADAIRRVSEWLAR